MSDNELDNLFKEAAEGFTPPQDESAWKQMAAMLDKNPIKPASFWNWKIISGLTVTGLIAVTAVWYATTGDHKITNEQTRTQEPVTKTNEQYEPTNTTSGVVQEQKEQSNPTDQQNHTSSQSVEDQGSIPHAVNHAQAKSTVMQVQPASVKRAAITNRNSIPAVDDHNDGTVINSVVAGRVGNDPPGYTHSADEESPLSRSKENNMLLAADSIRPVVKEVAADSASRAEENPDKDKKNSGSASGRILSVKAIVSPDFSSINYFSAGKTGINYGLLAGYSFNNRWAVYTGVISSRKLYDTDEIAESYSSNGHNYPVKELDGDCRILDIPVNVYYTFFPERSLSIRAGLGFSSYIMRKETYVYCVDNYGSDMYYQQQVKGENNEWFKVMNLSVAVSKKLSNRFSAEIEPFVKAPLAGVGEGKVSLVSMGAFFNLKYDLIIFK